MAVKWLKASALVLAGAVACTSVAWSLTFGHREAPNEGEVKPVDSPTTPVSRTADPELSHTSSLDQSWLATESSRRQADEARRRAEELEAAREQARLDACNQATELTWQILDLEREARALHSDAWSSRDEVAESLDLDRRATDLSQQVTRLRQLQLDLQSRCSG